MRIEYKNINELSLDPENSRFAELYDGSKEEQDLIEYLLYTESAEEVAKNISIRNEFYPDEALWVVPVGKKFLVKDGNRRCAAIKALHVPKKYNLNLPKMEITELPVLVYTDESELNRRIQEQHTHSLFREWDRIAKALKALEMHNTGFSEEAIREIDSSPAQLIKLASFYYEAVRIAGKNFKILLRRGRGSEGGKTIIFERLFSYNKSCGYRFRGKPSYKTEITDRTKFSKYINAMVGYLQKNSNTSHLNIDDKKADFLDLLSDYGFTPSKDKNNQVNRNSKTEKPRQSNGKRGSIKTYPVFKRRQVVPKLKRLIDECYKLDNTSFPNAKVALARVVFECVLKYAIEETEYKGKKLRDYDQFKLAFYKDKILRDHTNFEILRKKFIDLIGDTGIRNAFKQFDLDRLHQIIHNYKSGAGPNDARTVSENLIPLVEFMLKDRKDFLACLNTEKLTN